MSKKIKIRVPVAKTGVIVHKPKKGKGSYKRKPKGEIDGRKE